MPENNKPALVPILTGWKSWMEFNTTSTEKLPQDGWLMNLRIAGSISTNTVEKAVSWNVGPHGYQKGKKEIHKTFEQGPPIICLQDVRILERRKNYVKRELHPYEDHIRPGVLELSVINKHLSHQENSNGCSPITGSISPWPRVPGKTVETDRMYTRS